MTQPHARGAIQEESPGGDPHLAGLTRIDLGMAREAPVCTGSGDHRVGLALGWLQGSEGQSTLFVCV